MCTADCVEFLKFLATTPTPIKKKMSQFDPSTSQSLFDAMDHGEGATELLSDAKWQKEPLFRSELALRIFESPEF